jgi:uncharacterized protein
MILNMQALIDCPVHVVLEDDSSRLEISLPGVSVSGKARAEIDVIQGDGVFFCTGKVACSADIECSRCLEPYRIDLHGEIEFSIKEVADERHVVPDEALETELIVSSRASQLDITGPVREALILEIPLKPLCGEECRGLCPICGGNRNLKPCDCSTKDSDTRWDDLKNLFGDNRV